MTDERNMCGSRQARLRALAAALLLLQVAPVAYAAGSPDAPTLHDVPFDNEETPDATPDFEFTTDDPDGSAGIVYETRWSQDSSFTAGVTTRASDADAGFVNTEDGGDTSPFTEGQRIRFTVQPVDALSNSAADTAYYWQVRAKDDAIEGGSGAYGNWTSTGTFRVNTGLGASRWVQTTDEQFDTGTLTDTETYGSDQVRRIGDAVSILDAWTGEIEFDTSGFSFSPSAGTDRLVLITLTAEKSLEPVADVDQVTLGGVALTEIGQETVSGGTFNNILWFGYLRDADIPAGTSVGISWTIAPDNPGGETKVQAATYQYVDQAAPIADSAGNADSSATGNTISPGSVSVGEGDRLVYVAVCGQPDDHTPPVGYTEHIEQDGPPSPPDLSSASASRDATTASTENPIATWTTANRLAIIAAALRFSPPVGYVVSPSIDYDWVLGASAWKQVVFTDDEAGGDIKYDLQYWDGDSWEDTAIMGQDASPVDISGLDPVTYNEIRIRARFSGGTGPPYLQDWAVTSRAATKFVILDPMDGTVDDPITVTVQAQDGFGIVETMYQKDVTLVADGSATGGGLVDIVDGVGSLDISDTVAETVNLSLTDTLSTRLDVTSTQDVAFGAGAVAQVAFVQQPSDTVAGEVVAPAVMVAVQDAHGNTVASYSGAVDIEVTGGSVSLGGTASVDAVDGVASFDDLSIAEAGIYSLDASVAGLPVETSAQFVVMVTVVMNVPATGEVDRPVSIALAFSDGTGPYWFILDFGDGPPMYIESGNPGSAIVGHVYDQVGTYDVSVTVYDADSMPGGATDQIDIGPDVTPPLAGVIFPEDGSTVYSDEVTLMGAASEPVQSVMVNGYDATVDADTIHWYVTVQIVDGPNVLLIDAQDLAGNTNSESWTVIGDPQAVNVEITSPSANQVTVGESLQFEASVAGGVAPYDYSWDFGDGSSVSTTTSPLHAFDMPGFYAVTLTVADSSLEQGSDTYVLDLEVVAPPLEAVLSYSPANPETDTLATFDATGTAGDVSGYYWDWDGDGQYEGYSSLGIVHHFFDQSGVHTVVLRVEDPYGQSSLASVQVPVINPGEEAVIEVAPAGIAFHVRPGSQTVVSRALAVSNLGTPGTAASVTVDTSGVPGYLVIAPSASFVLAAGDSTTVQVRLDASLVPPDQSMELQSVGVLTIAAEGVAGSGAQVEVKVALEPYGSDGLCGGLLRNAGGSHTAWLAAALLMLSLLHALRQRLRAAAGA